ncbi:MAG: class D beta-lactamase [Chitinophagaceae bacterium]|nr:class D beta-lactamase [Chitinophagaceae bacterium]MBK8953189.1 class D beta-lactamase [Chitinophagaceae bacterium]
MKFMYGFILGLLVFSSCSPDNVKKDNSLKKYFDENKAEGCFALMNNATGKFTVYNLGRYRDSAYLPASTFKIVNSLIGLQTGKIVNDSMVIKWDGIKRWNEDWNKDLTMYEAFRVSSLPYYQEVARQIGKDTMQLWLDSLKYGAKSDTDNVRIKTVIDSFWIDNSLKVTPDQQLGLVKQLYFDQLPFFKTYQEMVKRAMLFENKPNYRLGYKTGWGFRENGNSLGWIVGWIEENNHPYFFVLNLESADKNFDMFSVRKKMLNDILKQLGFFEGKM